MLKAINFFYDWEYIISKGRKRNEYARILCICDTTQNFLILFLHIFDSLLNTHHNYLKIFLQLRFNALINCLTSFLFTNK